MTDLKKRLQLASERILGDERLTADLDDDPAQSLLDWGLACTERIVGSTANLADDALAETAIETRHKATRRMMRHINRWASQVTKASQSQVNLAASPDIEESKRSLSSLIKGWFSGDEADSEPEPPPQPKPLPVEDNLPPLEKIIEDAAHIYGEAFQRPTPVENWQFLERNLAHNNAKSLIEALRTFIEAHVEAQNEAHVEAQNEAQNEAQAEAQAEAQNESQETDSPPPKADSSGPPRRHTPL
jgi:hypothetical protein